MKIGFLIKKVYGIHSSVLIFSAVGINTFIPYPAIINNCLLYTSDAADEEDSVDLGVRHIIKKKKKECRILLDKKHLTITNMTLERLTTIQKNNKEEKTQKYTNKQ